MKLSVFQPWSEFVMKGVLPEELISKLIELTDIINQDPQKVSFNYTLAGEIENEWGIDVSLLTNTQGCVEKVPWEWEAPGAISP